MNSDKPLPANQGEAMPHDDETDHIPILDEALELPTEFDSLETAPSASDDVTRHQSSQDLELHIDLGYAEETEDYVEHDDLAEMDEIQTLPLAEMVLDDPEDSLVSAEQKQQIATLEAIVFEGENPNAPAPQKTEQAGVHAEQETVAPPPISPPLTKPLPKKSDNPFLPQHILDRLNQGKRNLVEEIAQSSAALDASTAILRTHARAERLSKPTYSETRPQHSFSRDKSAQQKQKIVDDLVEEYLPLIAAELRRRLRKMLDE